MAFGSMRGKIVDVNGTPIKDVNVIIINGPEHPDIALLTGADGRFDFGGLQPGRYVIRAYGPDFESKDVFVRVFSKKTAIVEISVDLNLIDEENGSIEEPY